MLGGESVLHDFNKNMFQPPHAHVLTRQTAFAYIFVNIWLNLYNKNDQTLFFDAFTFVRQVPLENLGLRPWFHQLPRDLTKKNTYLFPTIIVWMNNSVNLKWHKQLKKDISLGA